MEELIKRIKLNTNNTNIKKRNYENYNTKHHHILLRLSAILNNEHTKNYYKKNVKRIFTYFLTFLEKIQSKTIKVIIRNNYKYYYSSKLNLKDAEIFYLNTTHKNSSKVYYLSIIKKYIKLLNKNKKLTFSNDVKAIYPKRKKNIKTKQNIRFIVKKFKESKSIEYFCSFYILYFLGLSIYQFSKLTYRNYNKKNNIITFTSYKFKRKLIKKKKIIKVMQKYFKQFFDLKKKETGFLFFNSIIDEKINTRKNKIITVISNFMNKKLKIPKNRVNEFIEEITEERPSKRICIKSIFEPFVDIIDDSNINL